jgi:hypothetical protein
MTDTTYVRSYNNKAVVAPDFVATSDERLKKNLRPFEYNGRLEPLFYEWIDGGKSDLGFSAQRVRKQYPLAVSAVTNDGVEEHLVLNYQKLTVVLSAQLNMVEDRVIAHDDRFAELEAKVAELEKEVVNGFTYKWKHFVKSAYRRIRWWNKAD